MLFRSVCKLKGYVAFFREAFEQIVNGYVRCVGRSVGNYANPVAEHGVEFLRFLHGAVEVASVPEAVDDIVTAVLKQLHGIRWHRIWEEVAGRCGGTHRAGGEYNQKYDTVYNSFHNCYSAQNAFIGQN